MYLCPNSDGEQGVLNCSENSYIHGNVSNIKVECSKDGLWRAVLGEENVVATCTEGCPKRCKNNGVCVGIQECHCKEIFYGDVCQHEKCLTNSIANGFYHI